jgi:hypothetical protein
MPVVKFFAGLDLEQKSSFLDGHYIYPKDAKKTATEVMLAIILMKVKFLQELICITS